MNVESDIKANNEVIPRQTCTSSARQKFTVASKQHKGALKVKATLLLTTKY